MPGISTSIDIDAPTAEVWRHVMDFDSHESWNPFIRSISGTAAVGEAIQVTMELPDSKPRTFRPTVTIVDPNRTFEWLGSVGMRGVFDGRHRFDLEPTTTGTRLVQSERFTGVLAPIILPLIRTKTTAGFTAMNEALKTRCEEASHTAKES